MSVGDPYFLSRGFTVTTECWGPGRSSASALLEMQIGDRLVKRRADGAGPVHALDNALRRCLERDYPELVDVRLSDYRVSVVDAEMGTAAQVRVLIRATNGEESWDAGSVSDNIIDASFEALCATFVLGIMRARESAVATAG
jgi:2-isopropylmalate synthase